MFCITRREFETLNLHTSDGLIEIEVTKIRGGKVTIGVQAPHIVRIERAEIDETSSIQKKRAGIFGRLHILLKDCFI
jgi:carbon storage regulator CsrA